MTPQEATDLAVRIDQSFPRRKGWEGVSVDIWADRLEELDAGRAGTAYGRLLAKMTQAPSISEFLAEYGRVRGETPQRFGPDERAVSPAAHLVDLRRRAAVGDQDAIDALAVWEPMLARTTRLAAASDLQAS